MSELDPKSLKTAAEALNSILSLGVSYICHPYEYAPSKHKQYCESLAKTAITAFLETLKAEGWRFIAPGHIPIPETKEEAGAMLLLSENYLKSKEDRTQEERT